MTSTATATAPKIYVVDYQIEIKSDKQYAGEFWTTGYDICIECCGKLDGITASGAKAIVGTTVAADWSVLPNGTIIEIEGIGRRVVQDKGGAIKGKKLDILVNNHAEAYQVTGKRRVWIIER